LIIFRRVRIQVGLDEVLQGDQTLEPPPVVDQGQFLDLVPGKKLQRIVAANAFVPGNQRHRCHDLADQPARVALKAHVPVGDDAEQPHVRVHDRYPGDVVAGAHGVGLADGGVWRDGDRLVHHPGLGTFHHVDLARLILRRQVAMDDPQATLAGHGHRHPGLGNGVHRRADQWHLQRDAFGNPRACVHLRRYDLTLGRLEQHVVEGESERRKRLWNTGRRKIRRKRQQRTFRADGQHMLSPDSPASGHELDSDTAAT
jgi:hypothetical protein